MTLSPHPQIYDSIGKGYRALRVPDPQLADRIWHALGRAQSVCNVGAGTGSYEPDDRDVTAVEPSRTMISQRATTNRVVCAAAEDLPFADNAFDASMAILTVHHWTNARKGLSEMQRISHRQVVFTFDPDMLGSLWLVRDYIPEIIEFERQRSVPIKRIIDSLNTLSVDTIEIPFDCADGFQGAYWRRPHKYLESRVRAAISTFAQLPAGVVSRAMQKLSADLQTGDWHRRYADLWKRESLDLGYRLIVAQTAAV